MLPVYHHLASRVGTAAAATLARELAAWHDAMVRHERRIAARGGGCDADGCPHAEARELWARATREFGPRAGELRYLRTAAESAAR
ncbi:MAG: hypothetical protein ACLGHP_03535 [Vicinamibacteria bacterium]